MATASGEQKSYRKTRNGLNDNIFYQENYLVLNTSLQPVLYNLAFKYIILSYCSIT